MWKVVYIASTKSEALDLEEKLTKEGFLIEIQATGDGFQIKVPESEANDVYNHIINNMG